MSSKQNVTLRFDYADKHYEGKAYLSTPVDAECTAYDVYLGDEFTGTVIKTKSKWMSDSHLDSGLLAAIGSVIISMLVTL